MGSLKTPKTEGPGDDDADPDALLLEKLFLIEAALELIDAAYTEFIGVRLGEATWKQEVDHVREWINQDN